MIVAKTQTSTYRRGLWAEYIAMAWLMFKGYRILAHRYRTRHGEIDIIAKKRNCLVFIEVKARQNIMDALEAVNITTQRRIVNAARHYISRHPDIHDKNPTLRFDVIAQIKYIGIRHVRDAFGAPSF